MRAAPAVSCAKLCEETHTSIQVQRKHSGIPRAMVLRLMPCSPRRRIRLVTVVSGSMASPEPGWAGVPPRTWRQQRASGPHGFAVREPALRQEASPGLVPSRRNPGEGGNSAVRPARRCSLTENRPANQPARRRCRVHHIPSRVRDDRDPPLLGDETARTGDLICPPKPAKCFCARDWTAQISLKLLRNFLSTRNGFCMPTSPARSRICPSQGIVCSANWRLSESYSGSDQCPARAARDTCLRRRSLAMDDCRKSAGRIALLA